MFPSIRRLTRSLAARLAPSQSISSQRSQRRRPGHNRLIVEELEPRALPSVSPHMPAVMPNAVPAYVANSLFRAQGPGWQVYLQPNADAVLVLPNASSGSSGLPAQMLRLHFIGANTDVHAVGLNVGHHPRFFVTNNGRPSSVAQVGFRNVYPGIDVVYYQNWQKHLEFTFIIHPGANPAKIQATYQGSQGLQMDAQGNVIVSLPTASMIQEPPRLFQRTGGALRPVSGFSWLDAHGAIRFQSNAYDPRRVLLIDPLGNFPPMANGDNYTAHHDHQLVVAAPGVLGNDADFDHDPLTAVLVTGASHGSVSLASNGGFTYTPNVGYTGFDRFSYKAFDGQAYSNEAAVTITVTEFAPTAIADSYSTVHDHPLQVDAAGVLGNDTDSDGDTLTARLASPPSHGSLWYLSSDGAFYYVPNSGFAGTDSFTYYVTDGIMTSSATVTIQVTNTAPVANDDSFGVQQGATLNAGVLGNDTDADGDLLVAALDSEPSNGALTFYSDGSFSYVPDSSFSGSDSFTYHASDGIDNSNTATVTIDVHATNHSPVANNDSYSTAHDTQLDVPASGVLGNDTDADNDVLTSLLVSGPSHGALNLNGDGSFDYTPNANYAGSDSFTYKANDGTANSNTATVTISVTNTAPVAVGDSYAVQAGVTLNVAATGILGNDTDADGDLLTADLVSGASHGTLNLNSDGSFSYTPNSGFTGSDSFTYKADDGVAQSNTASVTLNVHSTNHSPVANNDSYSTHHDTVLVVDPSGVLGNDTDADNDVLTSILVSGASHGTVNLYGDGSFDYTPNANYAGTDSFTYKANDGTADSNTATVMIAITNTPPVAKNDNYGVQPGVTLNVAANGVLGNDTDADGDTLTAVLASGPSNGTLTLNNDGSFSYTPNSGFTGIDRFAYKADDGVAQSNTAIVTLNVHSTNHAPTAFGDSYTTPHDHQLVVAAPGVLGNDTDADGDKLTSLLVAGPSHGTLNFNSDGSFTYSPNANYVGSDSFTYKANDGVANSNIATVTISVTNAAPVANDDNYQVNAGTTTVISPGVLENDSDGDGDSLTVSLASGPSHGTLTLNAGGSFSYTPDSGFSGDDTFVYDATDGINHATATVTLHVMTVVNIVATDANASETGPDPGQFTVTRTGDASSALTVAYAIAGSAENGVDYQALSGTVVIPTGQASATIDVTPLDDSSPGVDEPAIETVEVTLAAASGYVVGPQSSAVVAIQGAQAQQPRLTMTIEKIDQDDPTNTAWTAMGDLVYGGNVPSTADNLRVTVAPAPGQPAITNVNWSSNLGAFYGDPGHGTTWNIGDIKPQADFMSVTAVATFQGGVTETITRQFEVGIRTDDMVVVGWIDPSRITFNLANVRPGLTTRFPTNGVISATNVPLAGNFIASLTNFEPQDPVVTLPLRPEERAYLVSWFFKFGGNIKWNNNYTIWFPDTPPADFRTNGIMDYAKLGQYIATSTRFKLLNHFQIRYRLNLTDGTRKHFNGNPVILPMPASNVPPQGYIGTTIDPITHTLQFPGQVGPQNNQRPVLHPDPNQNDYDTASQINDGSPDARGINAVNELTGDRRNFQAGILRYWENIGSRIQFDPGEVAGGSVWRQPYPTYRIYVNGAYTASLAQAASPLDHFYAHADGKGSYPFGTDPSTQAGGNPPNVPGGRNGVAITLSGSRRTPPSRVYLRPQGDGFVP
jgi:VCBS repeat-containing protein